MTRVLAIDFGATSVRVAEIDLDDPVLEPVILHRVAHQPVRDDKGILRWDWSALTAAVEHGISLAMSKGEPIASIGVDTWGVDYGLIDSDGQLISAPISYRDDRTIGWDAKAERLGRFELFRQSGVRPAAINTIFQLAAHDRAELGAAETVLMMPELVVHHLTGALLAERTSAGTTALVDLSTGQWSAAALDLAEIPLVVSRFPVVEDAGRAAGTWRGIAVTTVLGHDTPSAIAALPLATGRRAFVSSGSWLVVGAETAAPIVSEAAFAAGLSNEPGPFGANLLVSNIPGFVIVERLLQHWGRPNLAALLLAARASPSTAEPVDVARLVAISDDAELARVLARSGNGPGRSQPTILRAALTALARAVAEGVASSSAVTGIAFDEIVVVGGGARMELFLELVEQETGLRVVRGRVEAAAVGNALVQATALGVREAPRAF